MREQPPERFVGDWSEPRGARQASLVMVIPGLTRDAIDAIDPTHPEKTLALITHYGVLIVVIAIAQMIVRTAARSLIFNTGRDIEYELRNDIFRHLESLPQSFYQKQRTGDLMSRLINDIGAIRLTRQDYPGAEQMFRAALARDPKYAKAAFNLAVALYRQRKYLEAYREYRNAKTLDPAYVAGRLNERESREKIDREVNISPHREELLRELAKEQNEER